MSGESAMVLEVQGVMRFPKDERASLRLRAAGFLDGQEVSFQIELAGLYLRTRKRQGLQGEVLDLVTDLHDVDGRIGGFNFQWAWASGFVAGTAAAERLTTA